MKPKTVDEYIELAPETAQEKLIEIRSILSKVAPTATEVLKWGKPVFASKTILFAYSAHKFHLSFIPTGLALKPFEKELSGYTVKKDSIQFSYDKPLPKELIQKIAKYRTHEVEERDAKWKY
jgi:uncharacterized protein YdhG (YjbR/CyaY superfamily)